MPTRLTVDLPDLGAHLDATIVTGIHCRYRGDLSWTIENVPPASR